MSEPEANEPDPTRSAAIVAAILGGAFSVVALLFHGARTAASVAVGALIAVANLLVLRAIVRALIRGSEGDAPEGQGAGALWGLFAILKILLLFGGMWFLMRRGLVDPLPLVVGYGVLPLGIAVSTLWPRRGGSRRG